MKLIIHIGMGKTGSSAIQEALKDNSILLTRGNCEYLGMWPEYLVKRYGNFDKFCQKLKSREISNDDARLIILKFVAALQDQSARTGISTYLISNEGILGEIKCLSYLFQLFLEQIEIQFICYVRPPHSWVKSAYAQWGIKHKIYDGPPKSIEELAGQLLGIYRALPIWSNNFGKSVIVRRYDPKFDIVNDYFEIVGLESIERPATVNKTGDVSELTLRAVYNSERKTGTSPDEFDNSSFGRPGYLSDRTTYDTYKYLFSQNNLEAEIEKFTPIIQYIEKEFGISLAEEKTVQKVIDDQTFYQNVIDRLVRTVMHQEADISELKSEIARLKVD